MPEREEQSHESAESPNLVMLALADPRLLDQLLSAQVRHGIGQVVALERFRRSMGFKPIAIKL